MKVEIKSLLAASCLSLFLITGCGTNTVQTPAIDQSSQLSTLNNQTTSTGSNSNNSTSKNSSKSNAVSKVVDAIGLDTSIDLDTSVNVGISYETTDSDSSKEVREDGTTYEENSTSTREGNHNIGIDNSIHKDINLDVVKDVTNSNSSEEESESNTDNNDNNKKGLLSNVLN